MANRKQCFISDFYCTECGKKGIPIPRAYGKTHGGGHLKKIFCIHDNKETNHVEIRPFGSYTYSDFKKEFEHGRFINGDRIKTRNLSNCSETCSCNVNGKCWNTNQKHTCIKRLNKEV